jgi:hypothetical protein
VTDIREILRRLHLGEPDRRIARDLGISRNTVAHDRLRATRHGVLPDGPLPDPAALAALLAPAPSERPAHEPSLVELLRERVLALYERGVEGQAIWQLLVEEHGFTGSYSSVKRFLRRHAARARRATLRLEVGPGEEAQVDFGSAGQFLDPESGRVRRLGLRDDAVLQPPPVRRARVRPDGRDVAAPAPRRLRVLRRRAASRRAR